MVVEMRRGMFVQQIRLELMEVYNLCMVVS
jgi:hypothetical protein